MTYYYSVIFRGRRMRWGNYGDRCALMNVDEGLIKKFGGHLENVSTE